MKCPFCGADDTQVVDSRVSEEGDSIRRRRRCAACDKRFTTYETVELRLPQVVKANGTREEYDEEKLRYQSLAFWDLKDDKGAIVPPGTYTLRGRFYLYYDPIIELPLVVGAAN